MKTLILKGLGKSKVRNIVKQFLFHSFNECVEYGEIQINFGCIVDGFGLPEMADDDCFILEELVEFLGGKI